MKLYFSLLFIFLFLVEAAQGREKRNLQNLTNSILNDIDPETHPCQDFFKHACGNWLKTAEFLPGKYKVERSFSAVRQRVNERLRGLLEQGRISKASEVYSGCMDTKTRDFLGGSPLLPVVKLISRVKDQKSFSRELARLHSLDFYPYWPYDVDSDLKNPSQMLLTWNQEKTLTLDDRVFYIDEKHKSKVEGLNHHIVKVLELLKLPTEDAQDFANRVVALETELAKIQRGPIERRNVSDSYWPLKTSSLPEVMPFIDWDTYLDVSDPEDLIARVNLYDKKYFRGLSAVIDSVSWETHRVYMLWRVIHSSTRVLSVSIQDEEFRFHKQELSGVKTPPEQWEICLGLATEVFEELISVAYYTHFFSDETAQSARQLLSEIEQQFKKQLKQLSWLDDETKTEAFKKLEQVQNLVGYSPSQFRFQGVKISEGDLFFSVLSGKAYLAQKNKIRANLLPDRKKFHMGAAEVNAYYSSTYNHMAFPAAILEPPFFNSEYPESYNFGAIGTIMGHELTHGFDDEGKKFDSTGKMQNWWSEESEVKFSGASQCLVSVFSNFTLQDGSHFDGRLTLGETLADLGGLKVAYNALIEHIGESKAKADSGVAKFTHEQLFFISFGQLWCDKETSEGETLVAASAKHPPNRFRVNGALMNFEPFSQAFSCPENSPLNPPKKCSIW
eukprot:TRINITY_DN3585_c0_g1_i1.p1 TRINITY_DN3585_c0_g1~~TRINITY_DN3585_c0_g1_i1.p1  ORF type:complete len:672 (+),score=133.92 TRINITY_DN3585_c0_g1_i1:123-2138(+)